MTEPARRHRGGPNWVGVSFVLAALLVALVGLAAVVGRIGSAASPTSVPPSPRATVTAAPSPPPGDPTSGAPTPTAPPTPTEAPTASPSASLSPAAACSGTDDNRTFFEQAAAALPLDVYCARLGEGWSVVAGQYRSAGGGRLDISYRGPGGATLRLLEGSACAAEAACPPPGTAVGAAPFGDRTGELRRTEDGLAIIAGGDAPAYVAELSTVDEAQARAIGAALVRVAAP